MEKINKKQMYKLLQECDESDLSDIVLMALVRWHALQPEWEHFVFAVPLHDAEERRRTGERLYQELSQPRPDIQWDAGRITMFER